MVQQAFNDIEKLKAEVTRLRGLVQAISSGGHILPNITPGAPNLPTPLAGALIYGTSTPDWGRRAAGVDGEVLTMVGGFPDWAAGSGGGDDVFTINMAVAL